MLIMLYFIVHNYKDAMNIVLSLTTSSILSDIVGNYAFWNTASTNFLSKIINIYFF